jgi:hypothetical protein
MMETYRHGIVNTDSHKILRKGQAVKVLYERDGMYVVKAYVASIEQKIKKEDVIVN